MAELKVEQEDVEEVLGTTTQNHWLTTRTAPKRRKSIPKKRPMINTNPNLSAQRRRLNTVDSQPSANNSNFHGYAENGQMYSATFAEYRGDNREVSESMLGVDVIAKLQAELEQCKRENSQLKKKLADAVNIGELQTTLRMTLHSFGVPISEATTEHVCSCATSHEIPLQHGHNMLQNMSPTREEYDPTLTDYEEAFQFQQRNTNRQGRKSVSSSVYPINTQEHPFPSDQTSMTSRAQIKNQQKSPAPTQSQVELIPSSGVFVDATKLSSIPFRKGWSYTLLTRSLMPMVFNKEEMAASCVRGEKATGKGALTSPLRPALNQVKVQAIISFVSSQFSDIQPYQITQTMNQKLVDVRGTIQRKKQVMLPVQLKNT